MIRPTHMAIHGSNNFLFKRVRNLSSQRWLKGLAAGLAMAWVGGTMAMAASKTVEIKTRPLDAVEAGKISYTRDIKPILSDNCYDCHADDTVKGGLDVSSVPNLFKKGKKAGAGVVAGKPDESSIVLYIEGKHEPQMPKGREPLTEEQLHLIRLWILAGAKDDTGTAVAQQQGAVKAARVKGGSTTAADQEAISTLIFSDNYMERFAAQRTLRMGWLPKPPEPPKVKTATFNPIDQFIVAKWEAAKLPEASKPPPLCDDTVFLRRVYLDVIGRIPTPTEAQQFLTATAADKRNRLVDELLNRTAEYAANWTPFWEDALASSPVNLQGGIGTHGNLAPWIYQSFLTNKPYDVFVAELIDPMMPGYQKPFFLEANTKDELVGFIRNASHEDTVLSAANTAQVFLGTSMKCASCHNHFLNKEWSQARFMAFAGLFGTNNLELIRCEKHSGQFAEAAFPFALPDMPTNEPVGATARLHRVAQLIIDPTNPRFAKAMVNRLWKRYVGIGLVAPVDDFRLDQPGAQPELLAWLADDFIRHNYDLKQTIRLILTSRTYQLPYNPALEDHFDTAKPDLARYYRSPALRRLTAEELLDSMRLATSGVLNGTNRLYLTRESSALMRALGKAGSRNEISTSRSDDVAVVQALELMNGEEFHKLAYGGKVIIAAGEKPDYGQTLNTLYWTTLSRAPTRKEEKLGVKFLESGTVENQMPVGDVLWALFSSPEFQYVR